MTVPGTYRFASFMDINHGADISRHTRPSRTAQW